MRRLLALVVLIAALGASPASQAGSTGICTGATTPQTYNHVIVVMLENHSYSSSRGHMPYLDSVAAACGYDSAYQAITHPSLPNYLAVTGGSTFGFLSDPTPRHHPVRSRSIFSQLGVARWMSFHQAMPQNCLRSDARPYIAHHNPATYYTRIRAACQSNDVPMTKLAGELNGGAAPRYMFVVPDNCHNGHSNPCGTDTLGQADSYLQQLLPTIFSSVAYQNGRTLVVVTFDEGSGGSNQVYTVLASPSIPPGTVYTQAVSHYSLLAYAEAQLGAQCLKNACTAAPLAGPGL